MVIFSTGARSVSVGLPERARAKMVIRPAGTGPGYLEGMKPDSKA